MGWSILLSFLGVVAWLIPLVMLFIVPVNRKPSSATAWLLLMFALPFTGVALFLLIGSPKLPRRRRDEQSHVNELLTSFVQKLQLNPTLRSLVSPPISERYQSLVQLMSKLGAMPAVAGNTVTLFPGYSEAITAIVEEIERAQESVLIEYFALSRDEETEQVFAAMERAHRRGVIVRVLFDQLGSRKYPHYKEMRSRLTDASIEYHIMLPVRLFGKKYTRIDLRNHRKIVVIDGHTAFTGSQNMIRRNYFRKDTIYYDELVARVRGPVALQFQAIFLTDWHAEIDDRLQVTGSLMFPARAGSSLCQVLPSGSGFENDNNLKLFVSLFYLARQKVVITNPYFVPDDALMTAIISAAQRGVEVILINSQVADQFLVSHAQRSYYEQLLKSGVKIYWYRPPILLHSKHFTVDDDIAVIGSSNLDIRSFQLNMEVTLVCYDPTVVANLHALEAEYLSRSRLVSLSEWQARSSATRLAENISRLTSALQ
jgi:cardiolipin synthase